jgi:hypothetical protein
VVALTTLAVVLGAGAGVSNAKKKETYVFKLDKLKLPKGAPAELASLVEKEVAAAIQSNEALSAELPEGCPAPDDSFASQQRFKKCLKKKRMRAFNVTVQVTDFERIEEPNDKKKGTLVGTKLSLRMFGETIPDRTMAFTGDGSANVRIEVGKKVRERDREVADHDAIEMAIAEAVAASLNKLRTRPPRKPKK